MFYIEYFGAVDDTPGGDVFIFDYGVLACWGLDKNQEQVLVRTLARPAADMPFALSQMEVDEVGGGRGEDLQGEGVEARERRSGCGGRWGGLQGEGVGGGKGRESARGEGGGQWGEGSARQAGDE